MIKLKKDEYVKSLIEFKDCYSIAIIKKGEEDIPGANSVYFVSKDFKNIKEFSVSDIGKKELIFVKELDIEDNEELINKIVN